MDCILLAIRASQELDAQERIKEHFGESVAIYALDSGSLLRCAEDRSEQDAVFRSWVKEICLLLNITFSDGAAPASSGGDKPKKKTETADSPMVFLESTVMAECLFFFFRQVRELLQANHLSQLEKLLLVLRDLTTAQNAHARKGGLIGLAAAAIALGKSTSAYTSHLIEPVLTCFNDPDPRVRYYACEVSLYNIVKICRSSALSHFNELFDTLWRLSADTDLNVRSGAELLDRLLKV
ncbi:unnamed protein product [Gongylonema pulchrum]|uniref:Vac14_Fab1_bd domain-containing protein n=1 Tax=Gongylonema pulchrum TaxID=637853 RepID=A0A183E1W6_9BILA|nr:unnamed protein product [Gongylonema pulchrum]